MLRHRRLASDFGNNGRLARDELIERLEDVHAVELRLCRFAATGPGQRPDDAHPACRVGGAQGGNHVLRHAAAADQADGGHVLITVG
jgi:hypothetical protein